MAVQGQLKLGNEVLHYGPVGERLLARSNLRLVLDALENVYSHARAEGAGTAIASHYFPNLLELGTGRVPAGNLEEALNAILTYDKNSGDNIDGALIMDGASYRNRMHLFNTNWSSYFRNEREIEGEITPEKLKLIGDQLGTRHITAISASAAYAKAHPDSYILVLSSGGKVRAFQDGYAILSPHVEELVQPIASVTPYAEFHQRRFGSPRPPPATAAVQPA